MQRVLEPEVMDTQEDAMEYDAMDFGEANQRFCDDALALLGEAPEARAVDLGIGTGDIAVRMLESRPSLTIVGIDLSRHMLEVARRKAEERGVAARLELVLADAKGSDLGGPFDLVMSNSTAHHVPEPLALFREIARLAGEDAAVLVRDLFRPDTREAAVATVHRVAAGESEKQKQLFLDSLHAALTLDEVRTLAQSASLSGCEIVVCSDRHWSLSRKRHA